MDSEELKNQVFRTTMELCDVGLIRLSAGNISARDKDGNMAITPTGLPYSRMRPVDIVITDLDGQVVDGGLKPSSETPMHTAIYRRLPNVGAVVHTHSVYAIAFATIGIEIPVVCLEILSVGGPVPIAPYACPGSSEAGRIACECFESHPDLRVLLLRNHGLVAIGENLEQAFQNAYKCETGAQIYHIALQTGRTPMALSAEQIAEIHQRYQKA